MSFCWAALSAHLLVSCAFAVCTVYVFWNYHEPEYRQYDFTTENRNLGQFLQAAADAGLFINLRIGPFVCAEWTFGGLPVWLRNGMHFRTNDTRWEYEMDTFVTYILRYVEPWLARNGGPIILAQIENEYDNMEGDDAGNKEYVEWCGALTQKADIGIPWVMCSSHDAPSFIINTCNGFYWSEPHTHSSHCAQQLSYAAALVRPCSHSVT